jgi:hypothetical protein
MELDRAKQDSLLKRQQPKEQGNNFRNERNVCKPYI